MSTRLHLRHAFTLLELLVMVAVIGLLLAIVLPALSAASEAGRTAVCSTNLNQLFHGAFANAEDNGDRLPWYGWAHYRPADRQGWVTQVARSMEFEPEIYACPAYPLPYVMPVYLHNGTAHMADGHRPLGQRLDLDRASWPSGARYIPLRVSYRGACNMHYECGGPNSGKGHEVHRLTAFARPGAVLHLVEGVMADQYVTTPFKQHDCYMFGDLGRLLTPQGKEYQSFSRHFGTSNAGFLDGHVANMVPEDLAKIALRFCVQMTPEARNARC